MHFELKELNVNMGKPEYLMYQDIPAKESGSTNKCFGLPYDQFKKFLQSEINRKNNKITLDDTPAITYIMYVDNRPVGVICLRTEIDDNWLKWSGNFYYVIRKTDRNKGYGTKMLALALEKFRELGFEEVYGQSSAGNIGSAKVIENNGGVFLREDHGTKYYKIIIPNKITG